MSRDSIIAEINQERDAQDAMYGGIESDMRHSHNDWVAILVRQLGLAASDQAAIDPVRWRRQMVRLAAAAVAALESHDRPPGREAVAGDHERSGF